MVVPFFSSEPEAAAQRLPAMAQFSTDVVKNPSCGVVVKVRSMARIQLESSDGSIPEMM